MTDKPTSLIAGILNCSNIVLNFSQLYIQILVLKVFHIFILRYDNLDDAFRDTAGQERFRTITTAYYRGAMVSVSIFTLLYYQTTDLELYYCQHILLIVLHRA